MKMELKGSVLLDAIEAIKSTTQDEAVIEFKDDRWLMKSADPSESLMTAVRVPDTMMNSYEREDIDALGLPLTPIERFIESRGDEITIWNEDLALHLDDGDTHVRRATIDIESIPGKIDYIPDINHEIEIYDSADFLMDFVDRSEGVIGSGYFYAGGREEGFYLFCGGDNGHMDKYFEWSSFDDVDIGWGINRDDEEKATNSIFSSDFVQDIHTYDSDAIVRFGDHVPFQLVYNIEDGDMEGMSIAYILAPRMPKGDTSYSFPERIRRT